MSASEPLFRQQRLGTLTLRNRFAVAPMTRVSADANGHATDVMSRYYARFARGGFGMVITEGSYIDQAYSQAYADQPGLATDAQALAWRPVVDSVRQEGAIAIAQIQHAGALSQSNHRGAALAPSAIRPRGRQMALYRGEGDYPVPSPMSDAQISDAIESFGDAAARGVKTAGFDGVEVHGANGYLLDQFLTDYTNDRGDRWGGDVRARTEATVATLRAVRRAVGANVPVGVRLSQAKVNDHEYRWPGGERDAETIFGIIGDAGIDYVHITEFEAWRPAFGTGGATLAQLARRHAPGLVVVTNGNLHQPGRAAAALADGADVVAIGRGALAAPDLPMRYGEGLPLPEFDPALLQPVANVKTSELALQLPSRLGHVTSGPSRPLGGNASHAHRKAPTC